MRARPRFGAVVPLILALGLTHPCPRLRAQGTGPGGDAALVADFQKRVTAYADLHRRLEATLSPRPKDPTPEELQTHQHALERLIARTRAEVVPGHIFTEAVRPYFRRQLARVFTGPDGRAALAAVMEENPRTLTPRINAAYPGDIPLSIMPPRVLLLLPKLPPELEYRFIGERLVLLDNHANIVVDYMENAIVR